jgi:hypothetical protein
MTAEPTDQATRKRTEMGLFKVKHTIPEEERRGDYPGFVASPVTEWGRLGGIRKTQRQTNQALNAILEAQLRTNELLEQLVERGNR